MNISFSKTAFLVLALITLFSPLPAKAQVCEAAFETITTLRPPTFGFPTVWDAKFGQKDSMVQLASGVPMEGGTVFVIGRSLHKQDFKPQEIILAQINRRGRALKQEHYPAKAGEDPVKLIKLGNELVAISNMRGGKGNAEKWARLSWYDLEGKFKREQIIKDSKYDFIATNLVSATEQAGLVAVLHAISRDDPADQNGLLVRFTPSGQQLWRRAYRPGIPNMLTNLVGVSDSKYMATGRIRLDDGRLSAWALMLGYDGAINWQRTYPRGISSMFHNVVNAPARTADGSGFFLIGETDPLDGGPAAAWIMEISALGEPLWQRYFRRPDYMLKARWVTVHEDGRIILMVDARVVDGKGGHNHARMLTLSPRGEIINDEAYYEGLETRAADFTDGWNGERIMIANITDDQIDGGDEPEPVVVVGLAAAPVIHDEAADEDAPRDPVLKGWVFVATALDPYKDPCARFKR